LHHHPEKTPLIAGAIAAGTSQYGLQTFDQSLYQLYSQNLITLQEALLQASNAADFKLRVAGIRSTSDIASEEMETAVKIERFARQ
jgi:twitching motility protein PilT